MKRIMFSLIICLALLAGCDQLPSVQVTGPVPVISIFEASPDSIAAGDRAQLSWTITDAKSVSIDNGIGAVALSGKRIVTPSVTTVYTITATNQYGSSTATAQVIVGGTSSPSASAPVIHSFSASPSVLSPGESAILSWYISDATAAVIDQGVGSVNKVSGSKTVVPSGTTTYTLTASNASGSVTYPVTVTVGSAPVYTGLPVINYFYANPEIITAGSSTVLNWDVSNAMHVILITGGTSFGNVGDSGNITKTPAATQTYTLQASNGNGLVNQTITVLVTSGGGADTTAPGVPVLLSPAEGATLPQPSSAWNFDWSDSTDAESGILQYQLYVIHAGATTPAIDTYTTSSNYSKTLGGSIGAGNLTNWTWKVRAQNNAGLWSNWSPVRTFNVAGASHTVTLSPVVAETGGVYKDGTVSTAAKFAGDTSGNVAIRCYFSYDISALAGKNVTSAKLNFTTSMVRNPFGNLGGLWVGEVNYGVGPLQASDYSLGSSPFGGSFASAPVEIIVTTPVKNAVLSSDSRFQVRAHYASETNSDNLADYLNFTGATLTITYTD